MNNITNHNLRISTWNARGVNNKHHELSLFLNMYHIDIMLITETKLAPNIIFCVAGYKCYRADHPSGNRKGGSAILIKSYLKHHELPQIIEPNFQIAQIELSHTNLPCLKIGSFYSAPQNRVLMSDVWAIIHEMKTNFILGGDFNAKHPRFNSNIANPRGSILRDAVIQHGLDVFAPLEPTHYPADGNSPDVLDYFIGKNVGRFHSNVSTLREMSSDHNPVLLVIGLQPEIVSSPTRLVNHPFDWTKYKTVVAEHVDLSLPLKTAKDIDIAVSRFTNAIHTAASAASSPQTNRSRQYSSPVSTTINDLLLCKKAAKRRWRITKHPQDKTAYNRATRLLGEALERERQSALHSEIASLNATDGSLWRKTKLLTKEYTGSPPLKQNGRWFSTPQEKADIFCEMLYEQFSPNPEVRPEATQLITERVEQPLQLQPFSLFFTPGKVMNAIKRSPTKKAPGPDCCVVIIQIINS